MKPRKRVLEPQTIAASLRAWRKARGLTRQQAADQLKINKRTLEAYELGYRVPPSLGLLDELWGTRRPKDGETK